MVKKPPMVIAALAVVAIMAAGCKGATDPDPAVQRQKSVLTEIFELYQDYTKRNQQQPPKQLSDLKQLKQIYPVGYEALQKGDYVVVWGVAGKDPGTILAYEKNAAEQGGPVIMADGAYKTMTADEFKAAKH
jgi:hypothetical protein